MANKVFGDLLSQLRIDRGFETMRSFCIAFGLDPALMSKIETGKFVPGIALGTKLAESLRIIEHSYEWNVFFDTLSVAKSEIPEYVSEDENLAAALPALFRALNGAKPSKLQLEELIETLKQENDSIKQYA